MKQTFEIINKEIYPFSIVQSVLHVKQIINEDISRHIVLKHLAQHAGMNECTLKKCFRKVFKDTIYQYLLKERMRQAHHLLKTTKMRETDIAISCGFETLAGFITSFRRYYGMTPGELR